MRWIFLIVLSLNLVYIAWQINAPADDPYVSVQPLRNVQPIVLLSELKQREAKQGKNVSQVADSQVESQQLEESQNEAHQGEASQNEYAALDVPEQKEAVEQSDAERAVVLESAEKAMEKADAELAKTDDAETENVKQTVVAEIKQTASTEAVLVEAVLTKESREPSSAEPGCFSSGPFYDLDKLRSFTREIKSYVIETDFRGSEEQEPTLYWVYIEPEKSHKKAIETGKRLKAKKIKDFFVIREGEKMHGLSLGYFRNKGGAYGLASKVEKLGFNVTVDLVIKTRTIYWLDYRLASGVTIPQAIFDKYSKPSQKDKITRLSRDCDVRD